MNELSTKGFLKVIHGIEKDSLENYFSHGDSELSRIQSGLFPYLEYKDTILLSELLTVKTLIEATNLTFNSFFDTQETDEMPKETAKDIKDYQKLADKVVKYFIMATKQYIETLEFKRKGKDHA